MMKKSIKQSIREYIASSFLDEGQIVTLQNDDDLLTVLDSLQILRMLMDLEAEYSIQVEPSEFTPENLGSVDRMAEFIGRKLGEAVC